MRESKIEKYLVKRVKEVGGEVRKVQWLGRNGAPDRRVMLPPRIVPPARPVVQPNFLRRAEGIWVELKATGVAPEAHQLREHERMRALGEHVVVIDSLEGVEDLLR
jgi:hypothetical protein